MKRLILPAVLTDSLIQAKQYWDQARQWQTGLHIDVIDGQFADNLTLSVSDWPQLGDLREHELHLMVQTSTEAVKQALDAGFGRILMQIETLDQPLRFAQDVTNAKCQAGVVLDLPTPVSVLQPDWCRWLDVVLLMSVKAGFGGQKFHQQVKEKLQALVQFRHRHQLSFAIGLDGGIKPHLVAELFALGADRLVIGSGIWASDQPDRVWKQLQQLRAQSMIEAE